MPLDRTPSECREFDSHLELNQQYGLQIFEETCEAKTKDFLNSFCCSRCEREKPVDLVGVQETQEFYGLFSTGFWIRGEEGSLEREWLE